MQVLLDQGVGCVVTTLGARGGASCPGRDFGAWRSIRWMWWIPPGRGMPLTRGSPAPSLKEMEPRGSRRFRRPGGRSWLSPGWEPRTACRRGRKWKLFMEAERKDRPVKKTMLLNSHLSRVISELGHTDHIVIARCRSSDPGGDGANRSGSTSRHSRPLGDAGGGIVGDDGGKSDSGRGDDRGEPLSASDSDRGTSGDGHGRRSPMRN